MEIGSTKDTKGHQVKNRDRDRDRDRDRKINDLEKEEGEDSRKDRKVTPRGGELDKGGRVFQPANS